MSSTNGTSTSQEVLQGEGSAMPAYLSTQPPPNMNWQITLKDKVIAITGVSKLSWQQMVRECS